MKGTVLGFDESKSSGMIRGDDGNRYQFVRSEFNSDQAPTAGIEIDFDTEEGMAKDIYIIQKAASQGVNMQEMQAKAADMIGDISSNQDVIKAKESVAAGFATSPVAIVSLLVFAVAVFLPFYSASYGWFGFEISLFDTTLGKVVFGMAVLMLVLIGGDIIESKKTISRLGGISLLILPVIAFVVQVSDIASATSAFNRNGSFEKVMGVVTSNGELGIGSYVMFISALVLIFAPIKK